MIDFRSHYVIALGGNLPSYAGSPAATLKNSVSEMCSRGLVIRAVSRFYRTPCFPAGTGPDYVNAAVCVASDLDPWAMITLLHEVENTFGRARVQRWGERTLDLDLLSAGQKVSPDLETYQRWQNLLPDLQIQATPDQLILPHPRLQDRAFVLVPMADIAPDWVHPVLQKTTRDLLAACPQAEIDAVRPL